MSENSYLHRSNNWGGKPHVDKYVRDSSGNVISRSDGHSPTLNPPVTNSDGSIPLGNKKDLPPPYGKI